MGVQVPEKSPEASRKSSQVVIDINDIRRSMRMTHAFSGRGRIALGLRRPRRNAGGEDFLTVLMLTAFIFMVHSYRRMRAAKVRQALKGNAIVVVDKNPMRSSALLSCTAVELLVCDHSRD